MNWCAEKNHVAVYLCGYHHCAGVCRRYAGRSAAVSVGFHVGLCISGQVAVCVHLGDRGEDENLGLNPLHH